MDVVIDFQRARRPDQIEARRAAILDTAYAMLQERSLSAISLRELADRVGLAKSNVLRYFDSREAIFLEILDLIWHAWLDELGVTLRMLDGRLPVPYPHETAVATAIATSLSRRPILCELISARAGVLEHNIAVDTATRHATALPTTTLPTTTRPTATRPTTARPITARPITARPTTTRPTTTRRAAADADRLAAIVHAAVPKLTPDEASRFAHAVVVVVAGAWPYASRTEASRTEAGRTDANPTAADTYETDANQAAANPDETDANQAAANQKADANPTSASWTAMTEIRASAEQDLAEILTSVLVGLAARRGR
jgi:AcrR family transcriptional regulator